MSSATLLPPADVSDAVAFSFVGQRRLRFRKSAIDESIGQKWFGYKADQTWAFTDYAGHAR